MGGALDCRVGKERDAHASGQKCSEASRRCIKVGAAKAHGRDAGASRSHGGVTSRIRGAIQGLNEKKFQAKPTLKRWRRVILVKRALRVLKIAGVPVRAPRKVNDASDRGKAFKKMLAP